MIDARHLKAREEHAAWLKGDDVPGWERREPRLLSRERWEWIMGNTTYRPHLRPCNCHHHRDDDPASLFLQTPYDCDLVRVKGANGMVTVNEHTGEIVDEPI